ncbi:MAG: LysE family transporter [Dehalococcoidia bacterium]|nr:LysE family transporter [Dehalococcoidia bacterium]
MIELLKEFFPLWIFIILMVSTPGPANLIIMSSGTQNGFIKSIPFTLGVISGKILLNISLSLGLGVILFEYEIISKILSYVCLSYMVWLALKGWNNHKNLEGKNKIMKYKDGLLVHPLSPKAWAMCLIAYSEFTSNFEGFFQIFLLIPLSFLIAQLIFHNAWCFAGSILKKTIGSNSILNRTLIISTILIVIWAVFFI